MKAKILFAILVIVSVQLKFTSGQSCILEDYPFNGNANDESRNDIDAITITATLTTNRFGSSNGAYDFDLGMIGETVDESCSKGVFYLNVKTAEESTSKKLIVY